MILLSFDTEEFDVPREHGVDFSLEEGMKVSIEGTNRILDGTKPYGNIICYRDLTNEMEEAMVLFSGFDREKGKEYWIVEPAPKVIEKYKDAIAKLETVMNSMGLECKPEEVVNIPQGENSNTFVDAFKEHFLDFVSKSKLTSSKDIPQALEDIHIRDRQEKKEFQDAFIALLSGTFDSDTVYFITKFIYNHVRCNLFHGAKFYSDMKREGQQERFNIYTSFLIALCQMGLSFLDYKVSPQGINQRIEAAFKKISPCEQPKSEVRQER